MKFNVLIVLGKLLLNGRITEEYAQRVVAVVDYLKRNPWPDLMVFCGGNNGSHLAEACAGAEFLKERVDFPEERIYRETHSRNTLENILKTISYIKENCLKNGLSPEEVMLLVVTQKYHHERIRRIDALIEECSPIKAVEKVGMSYSAIEAKYPYPKTNSPLEKWCTEIYLAADRVSICQLNIAGFVNGKAKKIHLCLSDLLQKECENLAQLISAMPYAKESEKENQRAIEIMRQVSGELGFSMIPVCHGMKNAYGRALDRKETENLAYAGILLRKSIEAIREASDPDRLAF